MPMAIIANEMMKMTVRLMTFLPFTDIFGGADGRANRRKPSPEAEKPSARGGELRVDESAGSRSDAMLANNGYVESLEAVGRC